MAKNNIVYAVLVRAVANGNAAWHVLQFKETLDGKAAWLALTRRYEGDGIKNQLASTLRNAIRSAQLLPGTSASDFINTFMLNFNKLNEMKAHRMTESEAKTLFLESIHHSEYLATKETLSIDLDNRTLLELVDTLQQKEISLDRQ